MAVFLYGSWWRPFWLDEVLQVAFAARPDLAAALEAVYDPVPGVLTNQNGFYQLIDFATVRTFGISFLAMRWPSIASGVFLLVASYVFLSGRSIQRWLILAGLVFVLAQSTLMYYVGEARPYMPYAATSIGIFAFLSRTREERSQPLMAVFGWASLIAGALFHAYFWVALACGLLFALWLHKPWRGASRPFKTTTMSLSPAAVLTAALVAVVVGSVSWTRCNCPYTYDPFVFMHSWGGVVWSLATEHFQFSGAAVMGRSYGEWTAPLLAAIFEVALWITLLVSRSARKNPGLVGGSIVVILGLASSLLIAFSSYLSNYHILEKQWVFGLALVPLGVTWQVADVLRWCAKWPVYVRWGPGALVVVAVGVALISTLTGQADAIREDRSRMAEILIVDEQAHPDLDDPEVVARDPVLMANILALRGGRMPPSFSGLFGLPPTVK